MHTAIALSLLLLAQGKPDYASTVPPPMREYFRIETEKIARDPLKGIKTAEEWKARRPELQRQFKEMLGLDPEPPRGSLNAKITGTLEKPDFVVERLSYESVPGLIVTANLYRPKKVDHPLPAIVYVCGHSSVEKDGVVLGCKTAYRHHAAWYASNGYVCLILDTLQLGELPGLHHGTNRFGMWWWQSLGYTPAGVEAWNAVRGVDYLLTRPEVDRRRLGVTGRSGGGATSWWVAAIDDRIKVAVPVAGITDLTDHVVDGVVQGHCDCMYHVNTYRWDFNLVAALAAPKALLVENTDSDPIFPEDGVRRIYKTLEQIYAWEGVPEKLKLVIGKGGHVDSEEIRHPSFAFMNQWLKGSDAKVEEPRRAIPAEELRVLDPDHEPRSSNARIHASFVKAVPTPKSFEKPGEWISAREGWAKEVRLKTFGGWPTAADAGPLDVKPVAERKVDGFQIRTFEYTSQPGIRLKFWTLKRIAGTTSQLVDVVIADEEAWRSTWSAVASVAAGKGGLSAGGGSPGWMEARSALMRGDQLVVIAPRGVGPDAWPREIDTHVRRRYALLGQTVDGMRVWDVLRASHALESALDPGIAREARYAAARHAAVWLAWASAFDRRFRQVELSELPRTLEDAPALLNIARIVALPTYPTFSTAEQVEVLSSPDGWRSMAIQADGTPR